MRRLFLITSVILGALSTAVPVLAGDATPFALSPFEQAERDNFGADNPADLQSPAILSSPDNANWSRDFSLTGLDGTVTDAVMYNGDLFIVGRFSYVGSIYSPGIARWDGSSWYRIGADAYTGSPSYQKAGRVFDLQIYDGKLYATGEFRQIDGVAATGLAVYDGVGWQPVSNGLGGLLSVAKGYAMVVDGNDLIVAGGTFTLSPTDDIVRWDGTAWSPIGDGTIQNIGAVAVFNGEVYASYDDKLVKWTGSYWREMITRDVIIYDMMEYDGKLLIAGTGYFFDYNETCVLQYDGGTFSAFAPGITGFGTDLRMVDGKLALGGRLSLNGDASFGDVALWDGAAWEDKPITTSYWIGASVPLADGLAVFGDLLTFDGKIDYMARETTVGWDLMVNPNGKGFVGGYTGALVKYDGQVIAAGNFVGSGGDQLPQIAAWDGSHWSGFGSDDYSRWWVSDMTVFDGELYASGARIRPTGGFVDQPIVKWNGSSWERVGSELSSGMVFREMIEYNSTLCAVGMKDSTYTIVTDGGQTQNRYRAGVVYQWDGTSWTRIATMIDNTEWGYTRAGQLTVRGSQLIVGGLFTRINGMPVKGVAAWDGSQWHDLAPPFVERTYLQELATYNDLLIVSGGVYWNEGYALPSGANNFAVWDGSDWQNPGWGLGQWAYNLTPIAGRLVFTGSFNKMGDVPTIGIAYFDGNCWGTFGSGVTSYAGDVLSDNGSLWVAGQIYEAGAEPSFGIARWDGGFPPCICCVDRTGDVTNDPDHTVDIADLTALIDHLFVTFAPLGCPEAANVNGDQGNNVDVADLTALIDHLFINYAPTASCY